MTKQSCLLKNFSNQIETILKVTQPFIWILSHEENRVTKTLCQIHNKNKIKLLGWSGFLGFSEISLNSEEDIDKKIIDDSSLDTRSVIEFLGDSERCKDCSVILYDYHMSFDPYSVRAFRDLKEHFEQNNITIFIVSPLIAHGMYGTSAGLPPTLEKEIKVLDYPLPEYESIKNAVVSIIPRIPEGYKKDYSEEDTFEISRSLQGLTYTEITNAIETSLTEERALSIKKFIQSKKDLINKSDALEFFNTNTSIDDIGGLNNLKGYLERYKNMFSPEAQKFGVEPLRGIIFCGIAGTGKSLTAKAVASLWNLPLLRLDVGKVLGSLVGSSEAKMRDVIKTCEAFGNSILWCDEVEKALSGTASSGQTDSGVMSRVFGTLLTAMQEGLKDTIVIATANDLSAIPPEFIRRFNEVFFVDLPSDTERAEIIRIHLEKRGRKMGNYEKELNKLVDTCKGFTGAEIEKAIKNAIATAFHTGTKDVTSQHILDAFNSTKPLSKTKAKDINRLREEAKSQYIFANSEEKKVEPKYNTKKMKIGTKFVN